MREDKLATVAMITFNSAKYVSAAMESALSQSYRNLELLIVDDASTDRTWEIICSHSDPRIRRYRNAANIGEYPNRNRGLEYARGEYLIYIDGDDMLYPHGLEFMVRSLEEFPESAMALARSWHEKIIYPLEITPREFFLHEFLGRGTAGINFAHILFRTGILRAIGGLPTAFRQGDAAVQYRIALDHNTLLISDGLAWWRRRPGQASESVLKCHIGWIEALKYRMEFLMSPNCPLSLKEKQIGIANMYGLFIRMAMRYFLKGRIVYGLGLLRAARIPQGYWHFALIPSEFSYGSELAHEEARTSGIRRNPFYTK